MLTPSELATILAALRSFQQELQRATPAENSLRYAQFEEAKPLTACEFDSLCERLNAGGP